MDVLSAILGTILVMLGLTFLALRKVVRDIQSSIETNAKEWYNNLGKRKFLFINYGTYLQYKVREYYERFGKEVFEKESPEEKEKAVKEYIERDHQKRRREARKQNAQ